MRRASRERPPGPQPLICFLWEAGQGDELCVWQGAAPSPLCVRMSVPWVQVCVCGSVSGMHAGAMTPVLCMWPGLSPVVSLQGTDTVQSKHITESGGCLSGLG